MSKVQGNCEPAFEGVRAAFENNFSEGDLGASCAVIYQGRLVADLWGGHRDLARTQPWERDTIVNVWSTTKMMAALCVLKLHDRGALSVDEPMARYWPEFGAAGKENVLVRHALSHTAAVPGFDPAIDEETMYDWDSCCANLAAQPAWWEPGTASGYHSSTQGYLLGELVRRVTGESLGSFLAKEITGPLGADFHIGLPDSEFPRVAEMDTAACDTGGDTGTGPGNDIARRAARGEPSHARMVNTDRWRRFEQPASNGHGNARSVAQIVSCLGHRGEANGIRVLSPETIERVFEVQAEGRDLILGYDARFGIGYGLNSPGMPVGINDRTCFWAGWGGSMAVIDVENDLTAVYTMNLMKSVVTGDMRGGMVIFAAHAAGQALREA